MKSSLASFRKTNSLDRIISRLRYPSGSIGMIHAPKLDQKQKDHVEAIRKDGFVLIPNHLKGEILANLQKDFNATLENCEFEKPCLAQSKIDPVKHEDLINQNLLLSSEDLIKHNLSIQDDDCSSYEQVISEFNPSTLTAFMMQRSQAFVDVWLDSYILSIISNYMGMTPLLQEAYVRRNFPSPYRTMNHFWHRDLNNKHHLLKVFFFLSDCTLKTGPHEYIRGSHKDFRLNNKRYFSDHEVDEKYDKQSSDRIISEVKAGSIIIEDTRGLHRAVVPEEGFRDLGYAVFIPSHNRNSYYYLRSDQLHDLTAFQQLFIPKNNIIK